MSSLHDEYPVTDLRLAADREGRFELQVLRIEDLLRELRTGRIRMAPLPGGIKWKREDALALFDSICRGYPIGILLFWETYGGPGTVELGRLRLASNQRSDAWWVVDGQQRLAALARVLIGEPTDRDDFALFFDLQLQRLSETLLEETDVSSGRWLPLTEVYDAERLSDWVGRYLPSDEMQRQSAVAFGKAIRDYEIPVYLIRSQDDATVREAFSRLSNAGHPLPEAEVYDGFLGIRGARGGLSIDDVARDLEGTGFGRISNRFLVRLLGLLGRNDSDPGGARRHRARDDDGERNEYRASLALAGRVIAFLQRDVGIPRIELLPWEGGLLWLGQFFRDYPEPARRTRDLLARWYWRASLCPPARNGPSVLDDEVKGGPGSEHLAVQRLLSVVGEQRSPSFDRQRFDLRFSESRLAVLALLDLKPRHLVTGAILRAEDLLTANGRMRVPKCVRGLPGIYGDTVFNRIVQPGTSPQTSRLLNTYSSAILDSHGISREAAGLLRRGEVEQFLSLRATRLRQQLDAFFSRKARWGETDRPPLSALVID